MTNTAAARPAHPPAGLPAGLIARYRAAKERHDSWAPQWRECWDYALPQRAPATGGAPGGPRVDKLFDGTAPDAVDQLAASLLARLTPPWARWFGLQAGPEASALEREMVAPDLERAAAVLAGHFERSNFAVEMHQCYLDLVTVGTASLLFEETAPGEASAFRFTAVPLTEAMLEEGPSGRPDATFRRSALTLEAFHRRFPDATLPPGYASKGPKEPDRRIAVVEAVLPEGAEWAYWAFLDPEGPVESDVVLGQGRFHRSPFVNFRWLKAPGEVYGRSPVMKALPDIKTANKVVELILKNASIAVTGIWQVDDDGVLNPATVKLVPGTIIPKAVGSAGLKPLEAPGRFDVSELVLEQLRARIRSALLVDQLGQVDGPRMTATEVLERSAEMARVLGATFGRLQSELLDPLVERALAILVRRGEIPDLRPDGRLISLDHASPLAREQAREEARNTLLWLDALKALGPEAMQAVDAPRAARWLGRAFGVPEDLIVEDPVEMLAEAAETLLDRETLHDPT